MIDRQYTPQDHSGFHLLSESQQELFLDYVNAAVVAKKAKVHGQELITAQGFVNALVSRRLADALDPARWPDLARAMQLEMNQWQRRMADHARRDTRPADPGVVGGRLASDILLRARTATSAQLAEMERLRSERDSREIAEIRVLWPDVVRPDRCTMAARGLQRVIQMHDWDRVMARAGKQPRAVKEALAGAYGGENLLRPMHDALLGPWAAVMDNDPSLLRYAAGKEATRLHRDLRDLPREAFETEEQEWRRRQDDLDDMPF